MKSRWNSIRLVVLKSVYPPTPPAEESTQTHLGRALNNSHKLSSLSFPPEKGPQPTPPSCRLAPIFSTAPLHRDESIPIIFRFSILFTSSVCRFASWSFPDRCRRLLAVVWCGGGDGAYFSISILSAKVSSVVRCHRALSRYWRWPRHSSIIGFPLC